MYIYGDNADVEKMHHQIAKDLGAELRSVMYDMSAIKEDIVECGGIDEFSNNSKLALLNVVQGMYISGLI